MTGSGFCELVLSLLAPAAAVVGIVDPAERAQFAALCPHGPRILVGAFRQPIL